MLGQSMLSRSRRHTRYVHIQFLSIRYLIFGAKVEVNDTEASDTDVQGYETKAYFHPPVLLHNANMLRTDPCYEDDGLQCMHNRRLAYR